MRPRPHLHTRPEPRIKRIFRYAQVPVGPFIIGLAANRRDEYTLAVERDFGLMRPFQTSDVADDVLQYRDVDVVFAIELEVVSKCDTPARAERQPFDLILLRPVRRDAINRG